MNSQSINDLLKNQISDLVREKNLITEERKKELGKLSEKVFTQIKEHGYSRLIFVCTHNSRRSQLAELWMRTACKYYKLENITSYSGGTEATAFNKRMVDAVIRFGFNIQKTNDNQNPKYKAKLSNQDEEETIMFSKKYDDPANPFKDFIAVMVCSQADADCPFVPGAYSRVSLPYEDPKEYDDTEIESKAYDEKVREIGREMLYLGRLLKECTGDRGFPK